MSEKRELNEVESDKVFNLMRELHSMSSVLLNYPFIPDVWFEATGHPAEYKDAYDKAGAAIRSLILFRPTQGPEFDAYPEKDRPHYMVFLEGIENELVKIKFIEDLCLKSYAESLQFTRLDLQADFERATQYIQEDDTSGFIGRYSFQQIDDNTAYFAYDEHLQALSKPIVTYFEWQDNSEYCEKIKAIIIQKEVEAENEIARQWAQYVLKKVDSITFTSANEHRIRQKGVPLKESFTSYIWEVLQLPNGAAIPWKNRCWTPQIGAYEDQITAAVEAKAEQFAKMRNRRKKAPAAAEAAISRTDTPETGVYIMQGQGLDDFVRQTGPADIPLMAYMISNKACFYEENNLWTAPLQDFLTLSDKKDTPETRRNIRESIKRLRQVEYSLDDPDGSGNGIDFAFGSETRVTRTGYIQLQVSDRAAIILKKCRLPLDVPVFLYRLPLHDRYTFKMWYKMAADIYINMGKAEVASQKQKGRVENRLGRLSVQKICEYIGLETELTQAKYFRQSLFNPFNKALEILATNNEISYYFCYPGQNEPIPLEEYNNISYQTWLSLILHFEMPVNKKALEGKVKALKENGNAERAKQTKQSKSKAKTKTNTAKEEKTPEPEKVFTNVTQGLFDETDE